MHKEVFAMKKFVPYDKLSKKEKQRLDRARRVTWNGVDPVTRRPALSFAYDRSRENRRWKADAHSSDVGGFVVFMA